MVIADAMQAQECVVLSSSDDDSAEIDSAVRGHSSQTTHKNNYSAECRSPLKSELKSLSRLNGNEKHLFNSYRAHGAPNNNLSNSEFQQGINFSHRRQDPAVLDEAQQAHRTRGEKRQYDAGASTSCRGLSSSINIAGEVAVAIKGEDGIYGKRQVTDWPCNKNSAESIGVQWTCTVCTFLNSEDNDICSICTAPRSGPSDKEPVSEEHPTRANRSMAEWPCKECTLFNSAATHRCLACGTPRNGTAPFSALETIALNKQTRPSKCVAGTSNEGPVTFPVLGGSPNGPKRECLTCGKEMEMEDMYVLDVCSHWFCQPCITEYVAQRIRHLQDPAAASSKDAFENLVCPLPRCQKELSRQDLRHTAGEQALSTHDRWLAAENGVLEHLCKPPDSSSLCPKADCRRRSLISATQVKDLNVASLRSIRSRLGKSTAGTKAALCKQVEAHMDALSKAHPRGSLCTTCGTSSCAMCGFVDFPASNDEMPPGKAAWEGPNLLSPCSQQQWFLAFSTVLEIEKCIAMTGREAGEASKRTKKRKANASAASLASSSSPIQKKGAARSPSSTVWAAGTGFGGAAGYAGSKGSQRGKAAGTGAGGDALETQAKDREKAGDTRLGAAMEALTDILMGKAGMARGKATEDAGSVVVLQNATCAVLFARGTVGLALRQLAGNDSILDISERSELYLKMLALLRALGAHSELLPILCCTQTRSGQAGKMQWTGGPGKSPLRGEAGGSCGPEAGAAAEAAAGTEPGPGAGSEARPEEPILSALMKLYVQSKVVLSSARQGLAMDDEAEAVDIGLVAELCDCVEALQKSADNWRASCHQSEAAARLAPATGKGPVGLLSENGPPVGTHEGATPAKVPQNGRSNGRTDRKRESAKHGEEEDEGQRRAKAQAAVIGAYKAALQPVQFRQVCMKVAGGVYDHYYRDQIMDVRSKIDDSGVHHQKRMLRLSKEIASLATTLPLEWGSSVSLRVDEERMDALRALIVGPEGTPYQNGIFLFDILLPPDYPHVPPRVHFLTTGAGQVRFNPNLYACGKVCLSLLGTWEGPGWVPGKSTLLQVLVSIQSLILVPDPYYNEPGFEKGGHHGHDEAVKYNDEQRLNTLQYALLPALRRPPALFQDLLSAHFRMRAKDIQQQCTEWLAVASRQRRSGVEAAVKEIRVELKKYAA